MVAADRYEFTGIESHGSDWRRLAWPVGYAAQGSIGNTPVTLVANGPGPALARAAVDSAFSHASYKAVVSTGVCGALRPSLRVGDVVVAAEVLDSASGRRFACAPFGGASGDAVVVSQDRVACTIEEKRALASSGTIVEMEAGAVAARANDAGIPFSCIRAVSDSASDAMPLDFNLFRDSQGRFRRGAIAAAALARPFSRVPALFRLQRNATFASAKLGEFFANCSL